MACPVSWPAKFQAIIRPITNRLKPRRLLWLLPALFCLWLTVFACWYLRQDYAGLRDWYFSLSPCLFEKHKWTGAFFTPAVKAAGNRWCAAGILTGLLLAGLFIRKAFQQHPSPEKPAHKRYRNAGWMTALALCSLLLSYWGNGLLAPANDETFSAMHSAGTHPFRAWSYYMLPNNHVLFNTLNALLGGWQGDFVLSGRIISALSTAAMACCAFAWLRRLSGSAILAFGAGLLLSLQLYTWGFGFQARGYALCSGAEWLSLLVLGRYLEGGERGQKWLLVAASVAGFAALPSFLYWYAALLLFALVVQLRRRRFDAAFWGAQLVVAGGVLLFYLPLLCFSGLASLAENRYVAAVPQSLPEFMNGLPGAGKHYPYAIFSGLFPEGSWLACLLVCMPLLLLFSRGVYRRAAFFGLLLWLSTACIIVYMRHVPFPRNLTGHFSFTLALCCLALIAGLRKTLRKPQLVTAVALLLLGATAALTIRSGRAIVATELYGNDVNYSFERLRGGIAFIPAGSTVGLSNGAFTFLYPVRAQGLPYHSCFDGTEDFIITHNEEPFAKNPQPEYVLVSRLEDYEIWQRKTLPAGN